MPFFLPSPLPGKRFPRKTCKDFKLQMSINIKHLRKSTFTGHSKLNYCTMYFITIKTQSTSLTSDCHRTAPKRLDMSRNLTAPLKSFIDKYPQGVGKCGACMYMFISSWCGDVLWVRKVSMPSQCNCNGRAGRSDDCFRFRFALVIPFFFWPSRLGSGILFR